MPHKKSQRLSFNAIDADKYGLDEAVILFHIRYWVSRHTKENRNFHDGYYWTYGSAQKLSDKFYFFHPKKIQRLIASLEKQGVILVGNYNKRKGDKTKWMTIAGTKLSKGLDTSVQALPINEHNIIDYPIFNAFKTLHDIYFDSPVIAKRELIERAEVELAGVGVGDKLKEFFEDNPTIVKDYEVFLKWSLRGGP